MKFIVSIDDRENAFYFWEQFSAKHSVPFKFFGSFDFCLRKINTLPKDAYFFIDSFLGENEKRGEDRSKELFDLGFTNLYMFSDIKVMDHITPKKYPWIKKRLDKLFDRDNVAKIMGL